MKRLSVLNCFLIVLTAVLLCGRTAVAQDVFKMDISKTGGKFADWVQKQQENFQTTMEQISESQFATFIGDGIKAAKDGIKYAQETYQNAVETYNKVKDAVVDSKEYKIAMLSKQIAEESKVLQDIQKEKESRIADLKANAELERTTLEEKLKQAQENMEIRSSVYQNELENAVTDVEKEQLELEIAAFKSGSSVELAGFDQDIERIESSLEDELAAVDEEFAEKVYTQGEKIAELTLEMKELTMEADAESGAAADPEEEIEKAMDDLSFKDGEVVSLESRKKKEETRQSRRERVIINAASEAVASIATVDNTKDEQENVSDTSETVNGKSETIQFAIKNTANQLDGLQKYLLMELKAIEAETLLILAGSDSTTGEAKASIDICDYEPKDEGGNLADIISRGKEIGQNAKDKINDVKDMAGQISSAAEDLQNAAGSLGGLGGSGTSAGGETEKKPDNAALEDEVSATLGAPETGGQNQEDVRDSAAAVNQTVSENGRLNGGTVAVHTEAVSREKEIQTELPVDANGKAAAMKQEAAEALGRAGML